MKPFTFAALGAVIATSAVAGDVTITETTDQDRPHFKVVTPAATYLYDRAGGGFSHLFDPDGNDWIAFDKDPLQKFPASAAAGYRGIPNAVFKGPDGGAGHPGFDRCTSTVAAPDTIHTVSKSGKWAWTWTFTATDATLTVEKADPDHRWWFLYEGTIAGHFKPADHYWATDTEPRSHAVPDIKEQRFDHWRWIYFGDKNAPRVLFVAQHQPDEVNDTLWYLGSSEGGAATAPDGMVVFGFGRDPGAKPALQGTAPKFTIGLVESTDHDAVVDHINERLPTE